MSSSFFVTKEEAQKSRAEHGERKKVKPAGERSSMHQWMMQNMQHSRPQQQQQRQQQQSGMSLLESLKQMANTAIGGGGSGGGYYSSSSPTKITPDEVAKHNSESDNWMVIRGVVYDVTKFASFHPGGADIMTEFAGKDVTQLYDVFHPWVNAESMMATCVVGVLIPPNDATTTTTEEKKEEKK